MVPYQCPPGSHAPCTREQQSPCGGIQTVHHLPYLTERKTSVEIPQTSGNTPLEN